VHPPDEAPAKGRKAATRPPTVLAAALHELHLPASRCRVKLFRGEHPVPLKNSFAAGKAALRFAARARAGDDLVVLASGGGSALMASPLSGLMKEPDKTGLHRILLTCGAPIATINTVRKHLSAVKGGRLAQAARRAATQATLVICDVDPERYEDVASGPSLPDRTTLDDMIRAIDRYGIAPALPVRVLEAMRTGRIPETPKPRDPAFRRSRSESILSNRDLRNAAGRCGPTHGLPAAAMPHDTTGAAGASGSGARPARGHHLQVLQAPERRFHHRAHRHERPRPLSSADRPGHHHPQEGRSTPPGGSLDRPPVSRAAPGRRPSPPGS